MANTPIRSDMLREIIHLKEKGYSNTKISVALGISRTTLIDYQKKIASTGQITADLLSLSEQDLWVLVHGPSPGLIPASLESLYKRFPMYQKMLKEKGETRKRLWGLYKQEEPDGLEYSQFCEHFRRWSLVGDGYKPSNEKPGERLYVDFAGTKLRVLVQGITRQYEIFIGVLGCSEKIFVRACESQKSMDFLECIQTCLHYYGGVPELLILDNLRSGVRKANTYDPWINENLSRLGRHYDMAILPTRSVRPKDKALVENAVKLTYQGVYPYLRDQAVEDQDNLNRLIASLIENVNNKKMQLYPESRENLFVELDKPALHPLPSSRFEMTHSKWLTVQKNCHIYLSEDKSYYSAPFSYVGKKVKVVYSRNSVEIYHNHQRIAFHPRHHVPFQYHTRDDHMPPAHRFVSDWSKENFLKWAREQIGEQAQEFCEAIFQRKDHPQQAYRACMGVLQLRKTYGKDRIEKACQRALAYNACSYHSLKSILERNLDQQPQNNSKALTIPTHENIRGPQYYQ